MTGYLFKYNEKIIIVFCSICVGVPGVDPGP